MRNLIIILLILFTLLKLSTVILKYFYQIPPQTLLYLKIAGIILVFIMFVVIAFGVYTGKLKIPTFLGKRR